MRVTAPSEQSQYARIVEAVRSAQSSKAPLQRLADSYAVWFTPITVALCAIAWVVTRDWMRVLSILVVATPCPLILATPVAIIGGINRAAKRFIIIRNGGALERLSDVNAAVFDKTGTITVGKPKLHAVLAAPGFERASVLRSAAAVEEHWSHLLARVLVDKCREGRRRCRSRRAPPHAETRGRACWAPLTGISYASAHGPSLFRDARMEARRHARSKTLTRPCAHSSRSTTGSPVCSSTPTSCGRSYRPCSRSCGAVAWNVSYFCRAITRRSCMCSRSEPEFWKHTAICCPSGKVHVIEGLRHEGHVVMMVGDSIDDAPTLSSADVGIGLAAPAGASPRRRRTSSFSWIRWTECAK